MVAQKQLANFEVQPMKCPDCGNDLFRLEIRHLVGYVPEIVCQERGGSYSGFKVQFYICTGCSRELGPDEWKEAARKAFDGELEKVLVPEDIKPGDNGKE